MTTEDKTDDPTPLDPNRANKPRSRTEVLKARETKPYRTTGGFELSMSSSVEALQEVAEKEGGPSEFAEKLAALCEALGVDPMEDGWLDGCLSAVSSLGAKVLNLGGELEKAKRGLGEWKAVRTSLENATNSYGKEPMELLVALVGERDDWRRKCRDLERKDLADDLTLAESKLGAIARIVAGADDLSAQEVRYVEAGGEIVGAEWGPAEVKAAAEKMAKAQEENRKRLGETSERISKGVAGFVERLNRGGATNAIAGLAEAVKPFQPPDGAGPSEPALGERYATAWEAENDPENGPEDHPDFDKLMPEQQNLLKKAHRRRLRERHRQKVELGSEELPLKQAGTKPEVTDDEAMSGFLANKADQKRENEQ